MLKLIVTNTLTDLRTLIPGDRQLFEVKLYTEDCEAHEWLQESKALKEALCLSPAMGAHGVVLDSRLIDGGEFYILNRRPLILPFVRAWVDLRATVRLELDNLVVSSRIEPATFRLVEYCSEQLHYRMPALRVITYIHKEQNIHEGSPTECKVISITAMDELKKLSDIISDVEKEISLHLTRKECYAPRRRCRT
jgi:hypothetical protein